MIPFHVHRTPRVKGKAHRIVGRAFFVVASDELCRLILPMLLAPADCQAFAMLVRQHLQWWTGAVNDMCRKRIQRTAWETAVVL